jgi:mono/diheme cytochrome c family protein
MRKALRWAALGLGGLVAAGLVTALVLSWRGGARLGRSWAINVATVNVSNDSASVARGRHLATAVTLCTACHGDGLGGGTIVNEPMIARIFAPNLTSGRGGIAESYRDEDFVRAIRHGVNRDGRGLMIMHSDAYNRLGEADLGAVISYVKSVAPVDHEVPLTKTTVLGRAMVAAGMFDMEVMPLIPAEVIDHEAPMPVVPEAAVSAEYGEYLVSIALCSMCHGATMTGGPPVEPGAPAAPNITVYGLDSRWSEAEFIQTIRTGTTPDGRALNADVMPWEVYTRMTDDELRAIRLHLAAVAK